MRGILAAVLGFFAGSASGQTLSLLPTPQGEPLVVSVQAEAMPAVLSAQGAIAYDPSILEVVAVSPGDLPGLAAGNFNLSSPGEVSFSWYDATLTGAIPGDPVFAIEFAWLDSSVTLTEIGWSDGPPPLEWIGVGFQEIDVDTDLPILVSPGGSPPPPPADSTLVSLFIGAVELEPGGIAEIPILAGAATDLLSVQGSLSFDPSILTVTDLEVGQMPLTDWTVEGGEVGYVWYEPTLAAVSFAPGDTLFKLMASVAPGSSDSTLVAFTDMPIVREIIGGGFTERPAAYTDAWLPMVSPASGTADFFWQDLALGVNALGDWSLNGTWTEPLASFQATFAIDPEVATLHGVTSGVLDGWSDSNWTVEGGVLTVSWFAPDGTGLPATSDVTALFSVEVEALATGTHSLLPLESPVPLEAASSSGVTMNATASAGTLTVTTAPPGTAAFSLEGAWEGSTLTVHVVSLYPTPILSYQTSITFPATFLGWTGAQPGILDDFGNEDCALQAPGILACSWFDTTLEGVDLIETDTLFSLTFDIVGSPDSLTLSLGDVPVAYEVVGPGFIPYEVPGVTAIFTPEVSACAADLDSDCVVDLWDLLTFLGSYGCIGPSCAGDFNGNGVVNSADLLILLNGFGSDSCCDN